MLLKVCSIPMAEDMYTPPRQYLGAERVLSELAEHARTALTLRTHAQTLILAIMAGCFICAGALFSILLSIGVETQGIATLLQGVGFSAGFFFVILTGAVLFTEVNVLIPAYVLNMTSREFCRRLALFWGLAMVGNIAGALLLGQLITVAQPLSANATEVLSHLVEKKMALSEARDASAWGKVVLSGMLANWLVGMAAFFAVMGRTIVGKYVPVLLAVSLFVAANFQHSPANVGYFALFMPTGLGPGWAAAAVWNLIPAAIGNMIGATLFVALPLHFAMTRSTVSNPEDNNET